MFVQGATELLPTSGYKPDYDPYFFFTLANILLSTFFAHLDVEKTPRHFDIGVTPINRSLILKIFRIQQRVRAIQVVLLILLIKRASDTRIPHVSDSLPAVQHNECGTN